MASQATLLGAMTVAGLALAACAPEKCEPSTRSQGIVVEAPLFTVEDIVGEGSCIDMRIRCAPYEFGSEFARGCERYQLLPRRAGVCTLRFVFASGETQTHSLSIVDRTGEPCENVNSFYAADPKDDALYVAPTRQDGGAD